MKRVAGFTCPRCGKKVTKDDIARKKGKGPKPKDQRRKRVKKEVVKKTSKVIVQPYVEQFEWKTSGPLPPGEHRNRYVSRPKPLQPIDRTFGETVLSGRGVLLSAPIPRDSFSMEEMEEEELERLKEERQALEDVREKLERQEKRFVVLVTNLDRAEERIGVVVSKLEELEPMLQNFATLMSRMSEILDHYEVRQIRQR